jgi:hypothetical protein
VDDPGKDGNASMPEQVKRPNPWKKKKMMMMIKQVTSSWSVFIQVKVLHCSH